MAHPSAMPFLMTPPAPLPQQFAVAFTFAAIGDEIPLHVHDYWHSCLVIVGSVEIYDGAGKSVVAKAGQFAEFAAGREHAVRSREAGTIVVHVKEPGH